MKHDRLWDFGSPLEARFLFIPLILSHLPFPLTIRP
jgi:hypothetical protein